MSSHAKSKLNLKVIPFKRRPALAKQDFQVDDHGSIVLLRPLREADIDYVNREIGKDNGFQPYCPTVLFAPRYIDQFYRCDPRRWCWCDSDAKRRQLSHPRLCRRRRHRLFRN
jgi:hypothetical protein